MCHNNGVDGSSRADKHAYFFACIYKYFQVSKFMFMLRSKIVAQGTLKYEGSVANECHIRSLISGQFIKFDFKN